MRLNVITFITNDYVDIFKNFFLHSLPDEVESVEVKCVNKEGYFRHHPFSETIEKIRTEFIISQIIAHKGEMLMMIDSDVVFSGEGFTSEIKGLLENYDIVFQNNTAWYNFGVFAVNCSDKMLELFRELRVKLDENVSFCKTLNKISTPIHDQHIINDLVRFNENIKHTSLSLRYFGGHFAKAPIPKDWILYHATGTKTMWDKVIRLNKYKKK